MRRLSTRSGLKAGLFAAVALFAGAAAANGAPVGNFKLLDADGRSHELHYLSDHSLVVLMAHGNSCAAAADDVASFAKTAALYEDGDVAFLYVNSVDDRAQLVSGDVPVLVDDAAIIGPGLGFDSVGDAIAIDTQSWQVVHRGAKGLDDAVAAFKAGGNVAPTSAESDSCAVANGLADHSGVTYTDDVGPLLVDNCVTCHREGGIGPFAMTDYNIARGFAPMIREVVRTKRMPPWHADPVHGSFANDRSLTADEVQTLVSWVDAGAPRGEGADPLAELDVEWREWDLGEPDLIIDIPAYAVPASGVVDYQYPRVTNPLDHDVWVRATAIQPGDRSALHHVITSFSRPDANGRRNRGGLGGYVPGMTTRDFPDGTGTLLPAGSTITFQMHYTPYGKETTDQSRLGLYFHDGLPEHRLAGAVFMNPRIKIPPHAKAHRETSARTFDRDILVYSALPHAHYRGKASEFRAFYPDGTEEVLLSVPNYDFNWQTTYLFEEPKILPAGTKVVHTTWWDNSAQNPANPDPTREVPWGQQSWDEMLFGTLSFRYLDEASPRATTAQR